MTEEEIRRIVTMTVKAMKREGMLRNANDVMYGEMARRLHGHFNEEYSEKVAKALNEIKTDMYYSIIPLYYGKRMTHEDIAEAMNVEVSTITRNKKRLCIELYKLMD